jgi:hypothetical protein
MYGEGPVSNPLRALGRRKALGRVSVGETVGIGISDGAK